MTPKQWHSTIGQKRLTHQLKLQSHQIERVFSQRKVDTEVVGGDVSQQAIKFDFGEQLEVGKEMLAAIKKDLLGLFGVSSVHFLRENGALRLQIDRKQDVPVALLDVVGELDEIDASTAVLGLDDEGNPLLHDFAPNSLSHILVQGDENAGKTSFLKTVAFSLAMLNKQSQLQIVAIAPQSVKQTQLVVLNYLPHMLEPVVTTIEECQAVFSFLEDEVQYRMSQNTVTPTILVVVDDCERLLEHPQLVTQLLNLLQNGPNAGIHLILAHGAVGSQPFPDLLKGNIPFHIIGAVDNVEDAKLTTGLVDSEADLLQGRGDFVTIVGDTKFYFQAAYIDDYELHLIVDKLHRSRPRPIVAQAVNFNQAAAVSETKDVTFSFANEEVVLHERSEKTAVSHPPQPSKTESTQQTNKGTVIDQAKPVKKENSVHIPASLPQAKSQESGLTKKLPTPTKRFVKRAPQLQIKRSVATDDPEKMPSDLDKPATYFETFLEDHALENINDAIGGEPIPFDLGAPPD